MEKTHFYTIAALWAFITCLFLRSSEDWGATLGSLPYLVCTTSVLALVYSLLAGRDAWSASERQLQEQYPAWTEKEQSSHRKRESDSQATVAALQKTIASQAKTLQAKENALFDMNTDIRLENNRLKRELRLVEASRNDATTVNKARGIQDYFASVRVTMAEAGIKVTSPQDFKRAIEDLCKRKPQVTPVAAVSLGPLSADLGNLQKELANEKIRADKALKEATISKGELSAANQTIRQQSSQLNEITKKLTGERQAKEAAEREAAELRAWKSAATDEYWTQNQQLNKVKEDGNACLAEIARLDTKLSQISELPKQQSAASDALQQELDKEKAANQMFQNQIQSLNERLYQKSNEAQKQIDHACQDLKNQLKAEKKHKKDDDEEYAKAYEKNRNEFRRLQEFKANFGERENRDKADIQRLQSEKETKVAELEKMTGERNMMRTNLERERKKCMGYKGDVDQLESDLEEARGQLASYRGTI